MYGEDKSTIEKLQSAVTELETLKIEIIPKAEKTSEINSSIEKMENQIKQVDEELLKDEETIETDENSTEENTNEGEIKVEEEQEIKISENSNLNILISNINVLIEDVNQAVKVEVERKAEEERKAKELAEKKAYVGTYKSSFGNSVTITITENEELYFEQKRENYKININKKNSYNGSITIFESNTDADFGWYIYPIGANLSVLNNTSGANVTTDKNKIRILFAGGGPDSTENVYYKVD